MTSSIAVSFGLGVVRQLFVRRPDRPASDSHHLPPYEKIRLFLLKPAPFFLVFSKLSSFFAAF